MHTGQHFFFLFFPYRCHYCIVYSAFFPCWCEPSVVLASAALFSSYFLQVWPQWSRRTSQRILLSRRTSQRIPKRTAKCDKLCNYRDLLGKMYLHGPTQQGLPPAMKEMSKILCFLFSFISLEILLNLEHNLGLGFLSIQKFDTTTRNTSMSHGMQTFS